MTGSISTARCCRRPKSASCRLVWLFFLLFFFLAQIAWAGGTGNSGSNSTLTPPDPGMSEGHSYATEWGPSEQEIDAAPAPQPAGPPKAPNPGSTQGYTQDWTGQQEPSSQPPPNQVKKPRPVPPPPANDQTDKYIRGEVGD